MQKNYRDKRFIMRKNTIANPENTPYNAAFFTSSGKTMKKTLAAALLTLSLTAQAAPDAQLTQNHALLRELQKNHADVYNALEGKTLADVTPAINAYLFAKLQSAGDSAFNVYANRFVDALGRLGDKDPKACHEVLTRQQTPSLFDLQQLLGEGQKKLDPALATLLKDPGGWTLPAAYSPDATAQILDNMHEDMEKNGEKNGLIYTVGGQTPDTPEKLKLACKGGTDFFKSLIQPKDINKITTLRIFLVQ